VCGTQRSILLVGERSLRSLYSRVTGSHLSSLLCSHVVIWHLFSCSSLSCLCSAFKALSVAFWFARCLPYEVSVPTSWAGHWPFTCMKLVNWLQFSCLCAAIRAWRQEDMLSVTLMQRQKLHHNAVSSHFCCYKTEPYSKQLIYLHIAMHMHRYCDALSSWYCWLVGRWLVTPMSCVKTSGQIESLLGAGIARPCIKYSSTSTVPSTNRS